MALDVAEWCARHLAVPVVATLFETGHLSRVMGLRLADGRQVVVKVRPDSDRLAGCVRVQEALWRVGFPAPQPILGPVGEAGWAVTVEAHLPGGSVAPASEPASRAAALLARFVAEAPDAGDIGTLAPAPAWTAWDHDGPGLWPAPDDRVADLNAPEHAVPWLDEGAARVRRRLSAFAAGQRLVVGHGDWEAQNLRWAGDEPLAVHDWDSVIVAPEAAVVGLAAAVWPCGVVTRPATVDESAEFLDRYQHWAGRQFSADEVEASWAAGLWVDLFNTRKAALDAVPWLSPDEAATRLRLAGA